MDLTERLLVSEERLRPPPSGRRGTGTTLRFFSSQGHVGPAELHGWPGDLDTVEGFGGQGRLTWTFELEVRLSDGKPYADLIDDEEYDLIDGNGHYPPGMLGTQTYRARWQAGRPSDSMEIELIRSARG